MILGGEQVKPRGNGISAARSNAYRASAPTASASWVAGQPAASITSQLKSASSAAITRCWGTPSTAGKTVRKLS